MYALIFFTLILCSCASTLKVSKWQDKDVPKNSINKILVVCINNDSSVATRAFVENLLVDALHKTGAHAVSSLKEFGYRGLANMEQEQTYLKLCNNGIDAVLTFAILHEKNLSKGQTKRAKNTNSFYYNKIWSYKTLRETPAIKQAGDTSNIVLEAIIFHLSTLSSVYWVQSRSMHPSMIEEVTKQMSEVVQNDMKRLSVINAQTLQNKELKPF